jgi:hypothetical protein
VSFLAGNLETSHFNSQGCHISLLLFGTTTFLAISFIHTHLCGYLRATFWWIHLSLVPVTVNHDTLRFPKLRAISGHGELT